MAIESVMTGDDQAWNEALPGDEVIASEQAEVLPADFPVNAEPLHDGSGAYLLKLARPADLKYKEPTGNVRVDTVSELVLNRLNGKMHRTVRNASPDMFRATVLHVMSGMSLIKAKQVEDAMDAADMAAVLIVFRFFTTPGRRTGP